MIRGSTYSALLHLSILAGILFGLPSLTFLLPKFGTEDPVLRVVVMSEKDVQDLEKKSASRPERGEGGAPAPTADTVTPTHDAQNTPSPSNEAASAEERKNAALSRPPKPAVNPFGGPSVVKSAEQDADGDEERTRTRQPAETEEEGASQTGTASDTFRAEPKQAGGAAAPDGAARAVSAQQKQAETRFSLVIGAPAQPPAASSRDTPEPRAPAAPPKAAAPSSPPVAETPPSANSAQEAPAVSQHSAADSISQIISEMAEKLPRLRSLRQELAKQRPAETTNPAIAKSAERMEQRSEEGYAHAQFSLAEMYLTGEGVRQNPAKAEDLLQRAAISGYLPAQLTLAMLAAEGRGMERNLAQAHTWLAVAADQGNRAAKEALPRIEKRMSTKDVVEARKRSQQLHQILVIIHGKDPSKASKSELSERLRIAAALGDVESVHVMLAQGADADSPDLDGRTAVIEAAWRGYPRIVKSLIDNGAKLDTPDNTGKNALMWAAINGHAGVINSLLQAGSPLNAQDNEGISALMRAAWNGHAEAVKALLEAKADPSLRDKKGLRVIDYARKSNKPEVVRLVSAALP